MKILTLGTKQFEKHFKVKFKKPEIKVHSNGFISVCLDWSTKDCGVDQGYKFKYVELAHTSSGGSVYLQTKKNYYNVRTASFQFAEEEVSKECDTFEITPWFDVTIASETGIVDDDKDYDYIFFHNTKYGIICWFAPKGWEDWDNAKEFKQ
jgi:hypothetical protein